MSSLCMEWIRIFHHMIPDSYASSTTYLTGMAVVKACDSLREKIMAQGAKYLECAVEDVTLTERTC